MYLVAIKIFRISIAFVIASIEIDGVCVLLKRFFDFFFSFLCLLLFWPLILFAWLIAAIDTRSNGFFLQNRVGRYGKCFTLIKIKTMYDTTVFESKISTCNDPRITKVGAFFRKTKIDELPQLINVFLGEMSFVGPRPDVPGYADKLKGADRVILQLRPGMTGPASIKYRNEELILSKKNNPEEYNDFVIWPDKVRINKEYFESYSFSKDLKYIIQTIKG